MFVLFGVFVCSETMRCLVFMVLFGGGIAVEVVCFVGIPVKPG